MSPCVVTITILSLQQNCTHSALPSLVSGTRRRWRWGISGAILQLIVLIVGPGIPWGSPDILQPGFFMLKSQEEWIQLIDIQGRPYQHLFVRPALQVCLMLPCLSLVWPPSAFIRHASSSTFKSALIYMFSHKKWTLHYKRISNQGLGDAFVTDVPTQQMWCPQYLFKLMIFAKTDSKGVTSSFHQSRNQTSKCRDASSFRSKKQRIYWGHHELQVFLNNQPVH